MADRLAVVTLHPVYSPDTLPFRSLTFSSDDDTVAIGRSSKSQNKNLVPLHNNGWFESRVMSRQHAVMRISMQKEMVYIRDSGSMHGTSVNDKKIPAKQDVSIRSGDILMFGNEVSRGSETFRPVTVRCECQWFDNSHQKDILPNSETGKPTTNSFSVPDDDDELVEVTSDSGPEERPSHPQVVIPDSDIESGSDMNHPMDLSSPVTSPEIKHSAASEEEIGQNVVADDKSQANEADFNQGSQQSPILLDLDESQLESGISQARPEPVGLSKRVLCFPPGAYPNLQDDIHVEIPSTKRDSADDSDPSSDDDDWSGNHGDFSDEESSHSGISANLDDGVSSDMDSLSGSSASSLRPLGSYFVANDNSTTHADVGDSDVGQSVVENEDSSPYDEEDDSSEEEEEEEMLAASQSSLKIPGEAQTPASGARISAIFPEDNSRLSETGNPLRYQASWPVDYSLPRIHSPSDKALTRPSNTPLPSHPYGGYASPFEEWPTLHQSTQAPPLPFPPFAFSPYTNAAQAPFNYGPHQPSESYLGHYADKSAANPQFVHAPPSTSFDSMCGSGPDFSRSKSHSADRSDKALESTGITTRVSISDIVEKSTEVHSSEQVNLLKRKACDFEAELDIPETNPLGDDTAVLGDDSLPDAQPQPVVQDALLRESQLTEISTLMEPAAAPLRQIVDTRKAEHRRKRVKITENRGGSFIRYAATAVMGAVVGGVATVATLASLPPDFFD